MNFKSLINKCLEFVVKRLVELSGIFLILVSLLLFLSLVSYSPEDPNFIFPDNSEIKNLLGYKGSFIADIFYQSVGLISLLFCITVLFTGIIIFYKKRISLIFGNFFYSIIYILIGSFFFTTYKPESFWLVNNGNGGFVGKYLTGSFLSSAIETNNTALVAKKHGLSQRTVYNWFSKEINKDSISKKKNLKAVEKRNQELELENKILKALLKKTTNVLIKE